MTVKSTTHRNPCDVPCGVPVCSCGSVRGNERSQVFWWSVHPLPIFVSAGLKHKYSSFTYDDKFKALRAYINLLRKQLTRVCIGNLIGFVGVQPHFLLATAQDARSQTLLEPEHAGWTVRSIAGRKIYRVLVSLAEVFYKLKCIVKQQEVHHLIWFHPVYSIMDSI